MRAKTFCTLVWLSTATWSAQAGERRLAYGPGEQSSYQIEYLGISAGKAQITIGTLTRQWGKDVWPIVAMAATDPKIFFYPVRDKFVSYLDPQSQQCIGSDLWAEENHKRRHQRIQIDPNVHVATVLREKDGEGAREATQGVQPGTADIAAAMFEMRNQSLEVGRSFDLPIFTGSKSFLFHATVAERRAMQTSIGERDVFVVRGRTEFSGKFQSNRDLVIYLTADEAHIPVRMEAEFALGTMVANLTDYKPGNALASIAPSGN